jgi:steroid 5-alpha reductase family enzyme
MVTLFVAAWLALLAGGTALWLQSLRRRDVSVVDVSWGPAFAVAAWIYHAGAGAPRGPAQLVLLATVTLWALRLALHIATRRRGHGEDRRYREMRQRAGASFPLRSLVFVFWLQATLAALLSLPFLLALALPDADGWGPLESAGLAVWAAGFLCEAVADWQLLRFQREAGSARRVMDRGLWGWSRHPNYFGEATLWWGWAIYGLGTGAGPWGFLTAAAMTVLLVRVSGVPLVEKGAEERRPGYRAYVERTSSFVPLPPRGPRPGARP